MNLENMENLAAKRRDLNGCAQLSVNVEPTNRAGFSALERKNPTNDARYLRGGWKTNRATNPRQRMIALTETMIGASHGCH